MSIVFPDEQVCVKTRFSKSNWNEARKAKPVSGERIKPMAQAVGVSQK
jgi:hypothetical protein